MSTAAPDRAMDSAVITARTREDVVVGNEIVRHKRASRWIHWTVAVTFFLSLLSGMPIWTPIFGWMAGLFGGLSVCRVVHPWFGIAFFVVSGVMFIYWLAEMRLLPSERDWLRPARAIQYMRFQTDIEDVGKYNGGQKIFFYAVSLGALGLLLSGLLIWFPRLFPRIITELGFVIHDLTFVLFTVGIIGHIYLGTAAEPGTFGSMVRGTVTRQWARLHHPRWYREVSGEEARRPR
jgi:formate dehydrogenase subunit gamma